MAESNIVLSWKIISKGEHRWLRPAEICEILRNSDTFATSEDPTFKPPSGSIFLFDKKVQRHFRKDGCRWKKAKDGKIVKEAHERLKVGGVETLHCYYAHREENENFQRRSYWMIDKNLSHMVLVHYLDVKSETATAEGVQHSRKTDEITPNSKMKSFASSSFNPSNFQHSQATDVTNLNSAQTSENTESAYNHQASSGLPLVPEWQHAVAKINAGFPDTSHPLIRTNCKEGEVEQAVSPCFIPTNSQMRSQAIDTENLSSFSMFDIEGAKSALSAYGMVGEISCDDRGTYGFSPDETGLWIKMMDEGGITLHRPNSSNFGDDETACVVVEPSHASLGKRQRDFTASEEGKSQATPHATTEEVDKEKDEEEEGNDTNQVPKRPKVTCGEKVDSAAQSHSWLESMYPLCTCSPLPATSAVGPLNQYTIANNVTQIPSLTTVIVSNQGLHNQQADHAQDSQPPVLQPTATTGVVISATTNKTAASESSNPSLVQSEPTSNANQDFAQDVVESQEKETEPTSIEPENGKSKAVVQNDFGTGKSHEFAEVVVMSSLKRLHELLDRASAPNTLASSSISTPTIDMQAIATTRATLEMDFISMAGEVQRTHMISGIQSMVDSNCFPTGTGPLIMAMLKQLEQSVPAYSKAYSEYDTGKNLTDQVKATKQLLQRKVQFCDSKEIEFQDLAEWKLRIEKRQAAILAAIHGAVKEAEPIQAQLEKFLLQQDQFKENEGRLKATLHSGDFLWTTFKNMIDHHLPT